MTDYIPYISPNKYETKTKHSDIIWSVLRKLIINKKTIKRFLKHLSKNMTVYKACAISLMKKLFIFIKDFILNSYPFIKMFIRYMISKHYYKLSEIDFAMKCYVDKETFEFFRQLNKIKSIFYKERSSHETLAKMAYYYLILLAFFAIYAPWTWFLLRVLTDPQNWMMHFFEDIYLGLAF